MKRFPLFLALLTPAPAAATPLLTLTNGGILSGAPGDEVGWGFSLTNDADWLVPTGALFCPGAYGVDCTQSTGFFTDFIASVNFHVIGPGMTHTEAFDAVQLTGFGSFQIDSGALPGVIESGTLWLTYDRYDCDLNDARCVAPNQTAFSEFLSASAAISIDSAGGASTAVPEPALFPLTAFGLGILMAAQRLRDDE